MGKKVLVIDDSATVRQQVRTALALGGFDVLEASDGAEGVERIKQNGDLTAVVCDVNMPRMNGLELLNEVVRRWPELPCLLVSGQDAEELYAAVDSGLAAAVVLKPWERDELLSLVLSLKKKPLTAT